KGFGDRPFILFYAASIAFGATIQMGAVVNLIDICYAMMALPNIIGTVYLAGKVKKALKTYNQKYKI
ncbi:MAG: alanine:cation symporter family protein, partial [Bacteriovoracaceae bacterium]